MTSRIELWPSRDSRHRAWKLSGGACSAGEAPWRTVVVLAAAVLSACGDSPTAPDPRPTGDTPAVQSVTPNTGSTAGGTDVTIRGLRFGAGATVTFGGRAATEVTVQSTETIAARTPARASAGPVDVVVTLGGRSGSLAAGFTYQAAPANALPVIASIEARGSAARQPADFANLGESLTVTAAVTDRETSLEQLEYHWSATLGTFTGSGRSVAWQAPATAATPTTVMITLRIVERYGPGGGLQQEVTGTASVALHDSVREVGDMARRFLTEFSKPQSNQDWQDIMRDFNAARCPDPGQVEAEREDVVRHYTNFVMHSYEIGPANVILNFAAAACPFRNRPGDACVTVPVFWDSTDTRDNTRGQARGNGRLAAAYASADARWWLCSSDFEPTSALTPAFYLTR